MPQMGTSVEDFSGGCATAQPLSQPLMNMLRASASSGPSQLWATEVKRDWPCRDALKSGCFYSPQRFTQKYGTSKSIAQSSMH